MSVVARLAERGLIAPPAFLPPAMHYETIMGSTAYGVSTGCSDTDIYGFCVPPRDEVYPHLRGDIAGFGGPPRRFNQWQQHHVTDPDDGREYDLTIYNIVDYFQLAMKNNPNLLDSLFTPEACVLHQTRVGRMVRERRRIFLHKGCWHTFKGYAYAQMTKMASQTRVGSRKEMVEKYGFDIKNAYHVVRLLNEAEMMLAECDLDLTRTAAQLMEIRRGEWTEPQVRDYFQRKEGELQSLYESSRLPHGPDEAAIKALLLECLEEHHGKVL